MTAHVRELREAARDFAREHGVDRPEDVALAVTEAVANAVVHAYRGRRSGRVRLTATCDADRVIFLVEDHGCGLRRHPSSRGAGLGLGLIGQLAEQSAVSSRPNAGTTVRMTFRRQLAAG